MWNHKMFSCRQHHTPYISPFFLIFWILGQVFLRRFLPMLKCCNIACITNKLSGKPAICCWFQLRFCSWSYVDVKTPCTCVIIILDYRYLTLRYCNPRDNPEHSWIITKSSKPLFLIKSFKKSTDTPIKLYRYRWSCHWKLVWLKKIQLLLITQTLEKDGMVVFQ